MPKNLYVFMLNTALTESDARKLEREVRKEPKRTIEKYGLVKKEIDNPKVVAMLNAEYIVYALERPYSYEMSGFTIIPGELDESLLEEIPDERDL